MKKIKWLILFVIITVVATFIAVSGFYINENSTAVVDWFNNKIVVTNDDYKDLVLETNLTISQLNEKVNNLEDENFSLTNDKSVLTTRVEELQSDLNTSEEIIQSYLSQIDNINTKIEENNQIIKELRTLINNLSADVIEQILILPEELQIVDLNFYWYENDCFIGNSSVGLYYFNYNQGTLTFISSKYSSVQSIYKRENIYLLVAWNSISRDIHYFNVTTGDFVYLDRGSFIKYFEYEDVCYLVYGNTISCFDFTNCSFEEIIRGSLIDGSNTFVNKYDNDLIIYCSSSSSFLSYFNLDSRDYYMFVNGGLSTSVNNVNQFKFKDKYYILLSSYSTPGLYEIDIENKQLVLVSEIPYDNTSKLSINNLFVFYDIVVFFDNTDVYLFDGEETVKNETSITYIASKGENKVLYEDDTVRYFANTALYEIFKYDKVNNLLSIVYSSTHGFINSCVVNENTILFTAKNICLLDITTDTVTQLTNGSSDYCYKLYFDIGDSIYLHSIYNSRTSVYRLNKDTLVLSSIASMNETTGYVARAEKILFYNSTQYCIYDTSSTLTSPITCKSYDSTLSDLENGIIFEKINDLDEGALYYKYAYDETFTTYIRSLVLVK